MKKQVYMRPIIKVLTLKSEGFICLSLPSGPGPGPGGGGQAKGGFYDEEDDEIENEDNGLWSGNSSPWGD